MAGLRILGGVLQGAGQGMVSQAEQMRKEALERLRMQREDARFAEQNRIQSERDEASRTHQAEQARLGREHQSEESKASRSFQAQQSGLSRADARERDRINRAHTANLAEDKEIGDDIKRTKDLQDYEERMKINQKYSATDGGKLPAEARMIDYLIQTGVVSDATEGWEKVRSAREKPTDRAKLISQYAAALGRNNYTQTQEEIQDQAARYIDDLIRGGSTSTPQSSGKPWERQW
jgi:hypothetical protein